MSEQKAWANYVGFGLHCLIGGLMILGGAAKASGMAPPDHVEQLGLTSHIRVIGAGELIAGLLLLMPRTMPLGILLTSSFWGGAICLHMSHQESYAVVSILLLISWAGTYLRSNKLVAPRDLPERIPVTLPD